jgi:hypothetical protein
MACLAEFSHLTPSHNNGEIIQLLSSILILTVFCTSKKMLDGKESPSNVRVVTLRLYFEQNLPYWI